MRSAFVLPILSISAALAFGACGGDTSSTFDGGADGTLGDSPTDSPFGNPDAFNGPWTDFPKNAVIDTPDGGASAPPNSATLFGDPDGGASSGGPCLVEPEVNSLYPRNWLRPRFHWISAGGENLFELRVHAANQVNDLVVYTAQTSWTMDKAMWDGLRVHSNDQPMTVSVRGGVYANPNLTNIALGSSGPLGIAPVDAPGAIVYWTTSGGSSLKGFSIGDESVVTVLTPPQLQEFGTGCIGCHTSTPDGLFAEMSTNNGWNNAIASVQQNTVGQVPSFLGAAGKTALEQAPRGISTTSGAHWTTNDYMVVTTFNDSDLSWVDLGAATGTATGVLARTGDTRKGAAPTWSHDGKTIVYVSTTAVVTGRLDNGAADLYSIPYANRAGGTATPINGASDSNYEEYYPAYSPDDALLAFDRIGNNLNMYNQAQAEVFVIPSSGGTATRLAANDPPQCTSKTSPGVTNSWPKWAPQASSASNGRTFYWVVFSSVRDEAGNPQLYVSPVVVANGTVTTYAALYLWNQPSAENNHTPAWDTFQIPPPPVR